jgi:hypothetical protein
MISAKLICILAIFPPSGETGCDFVNEDKPFQIQRWLLFREGSGDIASVCPAHGRFLLRGNAAVYGRFGSWDTILT